MRILRTEEAILPFSTVRAAPTADRKDLEEARKPVAIWSGTERRLGIEVRPLRVHLKSARQATHEERRSDRRGRQITVSVAAFVSNETPPIVMTTE